MPVPDCPRCDVPLLEQPAGRHWYGFFECQSCWLTFELIMERHFAPCGLDPQRKFLRHTFALHQGRTLRIRGAGQSRQLNQGAK